MCGRRDDMMTMNEWFQKLPAGRQKVLLDDKWMLAQAAWDAALAEAKASLVAKADLAHTRRDYAERDRLQGAAGALAAETA